MTINMLSLDKNHVFNLAALMKVYNEQMIQSIEKIPLA